MSRAAVANDLVATQARALKMPGLARVYEALARQAREEHWGYEEFLHEVLGAEQTSRRDSAVRHRLREARFPEMKTLDTFDFAATDGAVSAHPDHRACSRRVDRARRQRDLCRPHRHRQNPPRDCARRRGRQLSQAASVTWTPNTGIAGKWSG